MNNGIFVQDLLDKPSSDNGLTRTLSGPNPISLPYNYPGDDSWRIDKNSIALVFDTRHEADTSVTIPLVGGSYSNIIIDWGDGKRFNYSGSSNITYQYSTHGIYVVQIYGTITSLGAATPISNRNKLIKCLSLGNTITSLQWAFSNSSNLGNINLIEIPDQMPITCTSLRSCFSGCSRFNDPQVRNWNTSNITNMAALFNSAGTFNQPIGSWNTSNVTDLSFSFAGSSFNQPIGDWDVSKVSNFASMFNSSLFNQDISNWNTSSVTNMSSMLSQTRFNQPIGNWNVSNVINFSSLFFSSSNTCPFDQNLSSWIINSSGGVSVDMNGMFRGCFQFNNASSSGINNWTTSRVTNTSSMFGACFSFNQPLNDWDVSNVTNMSSMFLSAASFNQPVGSWDVSKVTNMGSMFQSASTFNQPLDSWNLAGLNASTSLDNFMNGKTEANAYSTVNYDALLIGWNNNKLIGANGVANWRSDLRPNFGGAKYTGGGDAATARAALVTYGWTITDGGVA